MRAIRGLAVAVFAVALTVVMSAPAQASLFLRFDPPEAAPGSKVVARTGGNGAFRVGRGESFPVFLVGLVRERIGSLKVDQSGNGTLRFEVPDGLPEDDYEVELHCPPCAPTSAGREDIPVGEFTILEAPGPPFPTPPPLMWVILGLAALVLLVSKLAPVLQRRRSPKTTSTVVLSSNFDELSLGALMRSPTLGTGDLGWGSPSRGVYLPRPRLNLHLLIAGATGSGKSTSVDRIEFEAARTLAPQVIHFDCKGRRDGAERFMALMLGAKYSDMDIRVAPLEPYDGWRGDERAHLNRLLAVQDFSDAQPYWTALTKDLLQQTVADGPMPPRLSGEFLERLTSKREGIEPQVMTGAVGRYRGFFRSLGGLLDGSWAFDDVEACYIELPGMARREDAVGFGRYLLEDFMHYIAERKDPDREVLLVLDDFSAISSGQEAVNLVERAREFNVGVILTTQSYAGLGPGADRIVDACNGALIVHRMSNPEPFISRAGTVWRNTTAVTEPAHQPGVISAVLFDQKVETPRHTTRSEEFARIDPNEARSLPPGHAFVIADGRAQRVAVAEVTDLHHPVRDLHPEIDEKDPELGSWTLLEMGRKVLELRRKAYADIYTPPPPDSTPPPPTTDDGLDF